MNRRIVPFSLVLAGSLLAYACSSSDSSSPGPTGDDGGSSGTTSGGTSSGGTEGGTSSGGPEGGSEGGSSGSPISGIPALTEVPGFSTPPVYVETPVFTGGNVYFAGVGTPSYFVQLVEPGNVTNSLHQSNTGEIYVGSTYDTHSSKLLTAAPVTADDGSAAGGGGTIYSWTVPTTTDGTNPPAPVALTLNFVSDAGQTTFDSPSHIVSRKDGTLLISDSAQQLDATAQMAITTNHVWTAAPTATPGTYTVYNNPIIGQPTGLALSADEKTLYVALYNPLNAPPAVVTYAVNTDGTLAAKSTPFASFGTAGSSVATGLDGLSLDSAGNLYVCYSAGVDVFSPTGTKYGTITVPAGKLATSVGFAGTGLKTLYVATQSDLYTTTVNVAGLVP